MGKSETSPADTGKIREMAGRLAVAVAARALWALIEKLLGQHRGVAPFTATPMLPLALALPTKPRDSPPLRPGPLL